jgi:hypothetical protein
MHQHLRQAALRVRFARAKPLPARSRVIARADLPPPQLVPEAHPQDPQKIHSYGGDFELTAVPSVPPGRTPGPHAGDGEAAISVQVRCGLIPAAGTIQVGDHAVAKGPTNRPCSSVRCSHVFWRGILTS